MNNTALFEAKGTACRLHFVCAAEMSLRLIRSSGRGANEFCNWYFPHRYCEAFSLGIDVELLDFALFDVLVSILVSTCGTIFYKWQLLDLYANLLNCVLKNRVRLRYECDCWESCTRILVDRTNYAQHELRG